MKKKFDNVINTLGPLFIIAIMVAIYFYTSDGDSFELMPQVDLNDSIFAEKVPTPTPSEFVLSNDQYATNEDMFAEAPLLDAQAFDSVEMAIPADEPILFDAWTIGSGIGLIVALLMGGGLLTMARRGNKTTQVDAPVALGIAKRMTKGNSKPKSNNSFPADLYEVVNGVLLSRGGKEGEQAKFWVERNRCATNPLSYTLPFDYLAGNKPEKIVEFHDDMVSRLYKAGYDTNIKVDLKRCIIEVFNPTPATFALRDYWNEVKALPKDKRQCSPGIEVVDGKAKAKTLTLKGDGSAWLVAGMPRAGKTQLAMSMILSLCAVNSPDRLSLIVADTKAIDTAALRGLPHLVALESDPLKIADITDAMVAEMRERQQLAKTGDNSFLQRVIALYVDEAADLYIAAGDRGDDIAQNIQQLVQTGLGLGFIVILASQRVGFLPTEMYSLLPRRCVLRVGSGKDSADATGAKGTSCHMLPKRQFEVFTAGSPEGERGQGFFVADPEDADYRENVGWFINDIKTIWGNAQPGWQPSSTMKTVSVFPENTVENEPIEDGGVADDQDVDDAGMATVATILDEFDVEVVQMWENAYESNPRKWNKQRVRETYATYMDKPNARMKGSREAAVEAAIRDKMQK